MNKKGADKTLSMYWFVILIIVAGGISAMVYSFYNHPYDVREIEANILINQISDCLSENGNLNSNLINNSMFNSTFKDNFLEECNLNFEVEEVWEQEQYYVEINFYKEDDLQDSFFEISQGNINLKADCNLEEDKERLAKCLEREFYALDVEEVYLIKILSVVAKTKKNVE